MSISSNLAFTSRDSYAVSLHFRIVACVPRRRYADVYHDNYLPPTLKTVCISNDVTHFCPLPSVRNSVSFSLPLPIFVHFHPPASRHHFTMVHICPPLSTIAPPSPSSGLVRCPPYPNYHYGYGHSTSCSPWAGQPRRTRGNHYHP